MKKPTWRIKMSVRCRVCNTARGIDPSQIATEGGWECQICGNLLDGEGCIKAKNEKF